MSKAFILPPKGSLQPTNASDPLPYYYRPWIGALYITRLTDGLRKVPERCDSLLEIGYGSGLLMPSWAARCDHIFGVDIHSNHQKVAEALKRLGVTPTLLSHDARQLPFPDGRFDVIVAFSFLEHVKPLEPFLSEMWRVLRPGGRIILGMPMVNKWFNALFPLIGCNNIEDLHITSPEDVRKELGRMKMAFTETGMPSWVPRGLRLYTTFYIPKSVL